MSRESLVQLFEGFRAEELGRVDALLGQERVEVADVLLLHRDDADEGATEGVGDAVALHVVRDLGGDLLDGVQHGWTFQIVGRGSLYPMFFLRKNEKRGRLPNENNLIN